MFGMAAIQLTRASWWHEGHNVTAFALASRKR